MMRRIFLGVAALGCFALLFLSSYTSNFLRQHFSNPSQRAFQSNGYLIKTPGCQIPAWDPYDPTVHQFFVRVPPFYCPGRPSIIVIKKNAVISLNTTILRDSYGLQPKEVSCTYKPILRDHGKDGRPSDDNFKTGPLKEMAFDVPLKEDFIILRCYHEDKEFFMEFVPLTPLKPSVEKRAKLQEDKDESKREKMNVIIVGIDSISKLNFERHFRKTKQFLRKTLGAIELHGYTKVADNTFPNLVPMLTGQFINYYWNETKQNMFFDDLDFIWKGYSRLGHRTLLAEDAPYIATFNYLKKGFKDPPTDYYLRPFAVAVEHSQMKKVSRWHCHKSKMEMEVVFDYLKSFLDTLEEKLYFAFAFVARLTHDILNYAGYADQPSLNLLTHMYKQGMLNNSLLVFMSDHGIRFGSIRKTYIGKFEERMPFMFLVFPPWFFEKYPEAEKNLRTNQKRLTTPFDIHATLLNLVNFTGVLDESTRKTVHGYSLLHEVPSNRTCDDAFILPHWCTCQTHTSVSTTNEAVQEAAQVLIETINRWVSGPFADKCVNLTIDKILDALVSSPNDAVLRFVRHHNDVVNQHAEFGLRVKSAVDYMLTISASPSDGVFEGTVRFDETNGLYIVLDDISRLDMYGKQSACIDDARLRKFCFCKNLLANNNGTKAS